MAEQLRLHQAGRNGTAVDRDERLARTARQRMQRVSRQLLAGTGFAGDQHRQFDRRELVQHAAHRMQRRTLADQCAWSLAAAYLAGRRIIRVELLAHRSHQVLQAERQREPRDAALQQGQPRCRRGPRAGWQHRNPGQMHVLFDPWRQQLQRGRIQMAKIQHSDQPITPAQPDRHRRVGMDAAHVPACGRQRAALVRQRLAEPEHAT